jgi:endogenous inhibitor of DNA gyrase (YacG/DUF329 family)
MMRKTLEYVKCESLRVGDSIMPLYRHVDVPGHVHVMVQDGKHSKISAHRLSAIDCVGEIPPGFEVHHIDENKFNNNPENLQILSKVEHRRVHSKRQWRGERWTCGKPNFDKATKDALHARAKNHMNNIRPAASEWHKSPEAKEFHRRIARLSVEKNYGSNAPRVAVRCTVCGIEFDTWLLHAKKRKFCSSRCNMAAQKSRPWNYLDRICEKCAKPFQIFKPERNRRGRFCSKSCAISVSHAGFFNHKIASIDPIGVIDVYDLSTDSKNFAANGVIVHNSKMAWMDLRTPRVITPKPKYLDLDEYMKEEVFKKIHEKARLGNSPKWQNL